MQLYSYLAMMYAAGGQIPIQSSINLFTGSLPYLAQQYFRVVCGTILKICLWSQNSLFPPVSAVEGIKSVPSVCVCVCLLVSALPAEPFNMRTQNLQELLTLTTTRMSLKVKVIGQRSRSPD